MHAPSPRTGAASLQGSVHPVAVPRRTSAAWIKWVLYGVAAFFAALVVLVLWFVIARPVQVLPRIEPAPAFMLTDQDGRWVSDADLRGRVLIINFVHTRCGERCAAMERSMRAIYDTLRADGHLGSQVRMVTITVDAQGDTPPVLRAYAARLGVETSEWTFLTGSDRELKQLIGGGYGVYYRIDGDDVELDQRAVLVDGTGLLRAEYDGARLDPAIVMRDIGLVEQEANSSEAARPIYEMAHLFVCYPR
jgi:protein SCO1/2